MNCFVIMPFDPEFDDVYAVIKSTVEAAAGGNPGRCFRLDESRPAGRITDRLLSELRSATICVADLTGLKPNVMWEIGYAMALSIPTVVVTQDITHLPFDIKDMQSIAYDRNRLNATLSTPLRRSLIDTLTQVLTTQRSAHPQPSIDKEAIGGLLCEIAQLKEIVVEAVRGWKQKDVIPKQADADLQKFTGACYKMGLQGYAYSRVIRGDLIAPYCYSGDDQLTGVFFAWRKVGDYWFARWKWIDRPSLAGFAFLKEESLGTLAGAWWSSEDEVVGKDTPPKNAGVPFTLQRQEKTIPIWAARFFEECEKEGLASILARNT